MRKVLLLLILITLHCITLQAQEVPGYANPEQGFERMRQLAIDGDYNSAKQVGYEILEEQENYYDVALYLARIHGWESNYDSAYLVLDEVISKEPELFEAYQTCVDLAYWENNRTRLEHCAEKALELEPESEEIIEKLNKVAQQNELLVDQPEVFMHYSYDHFSVPYVRNWHMLTAGGQIPFKYGTLIPYINGGYHAGISSATDVQLNLDAYLTLGKKNYALLGYGFSPNGDVNYLPVHRAAAEIWQTLPKGFGLSAGIRYFYWDQHFTFLTFSAEKYAGNYWFSFRNYLFFKELGVSGSYYLTGRRYFASKFDHLTLTLGYGTAPDEPLLVVSDLDRLNAVSCRIEYSKQLSALVRMIAGIGYGYEEYVDQSYRNRINVKLGCYIRIKN
jgi:YaiO family outer membrane protein